MTPARIKIEDGILMSHSLKTASSLFVQVEKRVAAANTLEFERKSSLRKKKFQQQNPNPLLSKSPGFECLISVYI